MSRSGVTVSDEALTAYNDLKLKKAHTFIIYSLSDDKTQIKVSETSKGGTYDDFLGHLPENDCRYAVYDFEYETSDSGKRSKIVFFIWSPDTAPIRSKMVYAASKEALRRALSGVATEIQGTDFSEVSYDDVKERVSRGTN